jgi:hypothetical protein
MDLICRLAPSSSWLTDQLAQYLQEVVATPGADQTAPKLPVHEHQEGGDAGHRAATSSSKLASNSSVMVAA